MATVFVQFSDAMESAVTSIYSCPQDPKLYPNQGTIDSTDPRYLAFVDPASTAAGKVAAAVLAVIAGGLTVTSTSTPAVNGVYAVDQAAQQRINGIETYVLKNSAFPGSPGTSLAYPLANGSMVIFPSLSVWAEFADAVANYVADLDLYAAGAAGASLPSSTVTIA